MVAQIVHRVNPKAIPLVVAAGVGTLIVFVVIGLVLGNAVFLIPLGVLMGFAVAMIVFGQVAQRAQYSVLTGQPGAAASIAQTMRGNWTVTPAIAANRSGDFVHRVVGRPGVILLSEGPRSRVRPLLSAEKKRVSRAASEIPIYEVQVGTEEGQVELPKLQRHLMKLPRNLSKDEVNRLNDRLRALPASLPMPKGPLPKGMRMPKGPKPRMR